MQTWSGRLDKAGKRYGARRCQHTQVWDDDASNTQAHKYGCHFYEQKRNPAVNKVMPLRIHLTHVVLPSLSVNITHGRLWRWALWRASGHDRRCSFWLWPLSRDGQNRKLGGGAMRALAPSLIWLGLVLLRAWRVVRGCW